MSRLTPDNWTAAGFRALIEHGPVGLRAEPLARSLGTTKGSFYWHFKDVPAFQTAMLTSWTEHAVSGLIAKLEGAASPALKLRKLADIPTSAPDSYGGVGVEPAIRAWAKENAEVRTGLIQVDTGRISYLQTVLDGVGVSNPDMAKVIYAAFIGLLDMASRDSTVSTEPLASLIDLTIALGRD